MFTATIRCGGFVGSLFREHFSRIMSLVDGCFAVELYIQWRRPDPLMLISIGVVCSR